MPLQDTTPKSRIDELYEKYTGGAPDYVTLRMELERINSSIVNSEANIYHDSSNTSYSAMNRRDKELAGVSKIHEKNRLYGIVLYKTGEYNKEIYIDVPTKTTPIINPDVFYTDPELDLVKYRQYLFEPSSLDYYSTPVVGGIAVVKIPGNFPNHIYTNPEDAIYLHMKRPDILVRIDDSGEVTRQPLGGSSGGLVMGNGQESSAPTEQTPEAPIEPPVSESSSAGPISGPTGTSNAPKKVSVNKDLQEVEGWFYGKKSTITVKRISSGYTDEKMTGDPRYAQIQLVDKANQMMAAWRAYRDSIPNASRTMAPAVFNAYINSAYRDYAYQYKLYYVKYKNQPGRAALPGYSNHQYGLAIDFFGTHPISNDQSPKGVFSRGKGQFYDWLVLNAPKYGFKRTVFREHWHWEYRPRWINPSGGSPNNLDSYYDKDRGHHL